MMKVSVFHKVEDFSLVLLITAWIVISQHDFDYSDIEHIGGSCYPKDSCKRPGKLTFVKRSCECDKKCHQFKDCCIDVKTVPSRNTTNQNVECVEFGFNWGVYAISKCPTNYEDNADIKLKCEDENDLSFPLAAVPATDTVSNNITYKNRYCAHCNNAQPENLRSWDIKIECKLLPNNSSVDASYVESHLTYEHVDDENFWGFYYPEKSSNQYGESRFYACSIPFALPVHLRRHVRLCRPNLVSTCADGWTRELVRKKCKAYTAAIYISRQFYRNPHCAICNNINIDAKICNIPTITTRERKPALSFTLTLNVNMNDGNKVRQSSHNRCQSNQQWDPFANRCRNTGCPIPGYIRRNGVCVRP